MTNLGKKPIKNLLNSRDITLPAKVYKLKAMANKESILRSKDTILPTELHIVKAVIFPAVM